jgi:hypothetical protein
LVGNTKVVFVFVKKLTSANGVLRTCVVLFYEKRFMKGKNLSGCLEGLLFFEPYGQKGDEVSICFLL